MLLSVPLALEYEAICHIADHRLAAGLSERQVDIFVTAVIALAEPVETHLLWRPQLRDANDEMVLEAAINGQASAIVTYNVADFAEAGERFAISILRPAALLKKVKL